MCGRFTLKTPPSEWGQLLLPQLDVSAIVADWQPRYNIAPTQPIAAILATEDAHYRAQYLRWGLVPFWADDLAVGNRMINARAETLADKPAFRTPLAKRRCAVVTDGYYEWHQRGKVKQPFWIHRADQHLFAFAGLWESNRKASQQEVLTATIITGNACEPLAPIHDRMPAILAGEALQKWLDPATSAADALKLLETARESEFEARPVSTHVNNPRHEDAACLTAMPDPTDSLL
jgi:putative SOS response-associated peptidase YedK